MTATAAPDQIFIETMFDRLSNRYNIFNRLTSMGLDGLWRKKAVGRLKEGMRVLDLGCGTGDLTLEAARMIGYGEVTALDLSEKMLNVAKKRVSEKSGSFPGIQFHFERRKAEDIPFNDETYDAVLSGFVLRNIYENIDSILRGVHASLRRGGEIAFLDFTEPPSPGLKKMWRWYMDHVAAFYGRILFGKDFPERYMTDSAGRFLKASEFVQRLEEAGFKNVSAERMMMGIIVLYRGEKADAQRL